VPPGRLSCSSGAASRLLLGQHGLRTVTCALWRSQRWRHAHPLPAAAALAAVAAIAAAAGPRADSWPPVVPSPRCGTRQPGLSWPPAQPLLLLLLLLLLALQLPPPSSQSSRLEHCKPKGQAAAISQNVWPEPEGRVMPAQIRQAPARPPACRAPLQHASMPPCRQQRLLPPCRATSTPNPPSCTLDQAPAGSLATRLSRCLAATSGLPSPK
jgi:hypothetical protein